MRTARRSRNAFSLVELLVAIIIICILAAMLFPVYTQAKQSGYKTVALSQAQELGIAMYEYVSENDGNYLPSTNYAQGQSVTALWPTNLKNYVRSEQLFISAGTDGKYPETYADRGEMTIGYNSATAYDPEFGCDDGDADKNDCVAFNSVASFDTTAEKERTALFASTPGGPVAQKYRGYEFNPYNGVPDLMHLPQSAPLTSDRDLVKELSPGLAAQAIEPVYARYLATGHDTGQTFVIFADGHARCFSAAQILSVNTGIEWRFR